MKAILIGDDKSLRWDSVPDPICGAEDCLIKIEAAALNRADLLQRDGGYPPPPGAPEWMGLEVAGTIVEMGELAKSNSSQKVGDKVCALLGGGGYAEYVSVRYDMTMPIPSNCSVVEAASLPEAFATSYLNLFVEGGAKEGDTLLLTGGNSGLASVMIPMAKAFGLRVITTVRSDEKKNAILNWGADRIVNTSKESLPEILKKMQEDGDGVDLAIDCLGGKTVGECLPYLNRGARWIMIASLAGDLTEVNLKTVYVRGIRGKGGDFIKACKRGLAEDRKRTDQAFHSPNPPHHPSGSGSGDPVPRKERGQGCFNAGITKKKRSFSN